MDKKKQNVLIGLVSILGVILMLLMLLLSGKDKILGVDDKTNTFTFKVYYHDNILVIDDVLEFEENETLLEVMEKNYKITTKKDVVNTALLSIDSYTTYFVSSYFSLYVNNNLSMTGPKNIILTGGLLVEWKWTEIWV